MSINFDNLQKSFERLVGLHGQGRRLLERIALQLRFHGKPGPVPILTGPEGSGRGALAQASASGLGWPLVEVEMQGLCAQHLVGTPGAAGGVEPGLFARILASRKPVVVLLKAVDRLGRIDDANSVYEAGVCVREFVAGTLRDRYLGSTVSIADMVVIATATEPGTIPPPLRSRCETIVHHGYDVEHKLQIARDHLVGKILAEMGVNPSVVTVSEAALEQLVAHDAREAGVAALERQLGELCRRAAALIALGEAEEVCIDAARMIELLGPPANTVSSLRRDSAEVGVALGLTWQRAGGELALVEAMSAGQDLLPLKTRSSLCVRPQSVENAFAFIRTRSRELRLNARVLQPEHVVVRTSLGDQSPLTSRNELDLAVLVALTSLASDRPVRPDVASVGGVTLHGLVQTPTGLPEMVLAAARCGVRKVLIPAEALAVLRSTLPASAFRHVEMVPVRDASEATRASLIDVVVAREFS